MSVIFLPLQNTFHICNKIHKIRIFTSTIFTCKVLWHACGLSLSPVSTAFTLTFQKRNSESIKLSPPLPVATPTLPLCLCDHDSFRGLIYYVDSYYIHLFITGLSHFSKFSPQAHLGAECVRFCSKLIISRCICLLHLVSLFVLARDAQVTSLWPTWLMQFL